MITEKTIIVSSPKRSGGTLLNSLFDSHPGVMCFIDEAFFWEHVYNYQEAGNERLLIDVFRRFGPGPITESIIDRAILPWISGTLRQMIGKGINEVKLDFDIEKFKTGLAGLSSCSTVSEIWGCLAAAYADALPYNCGGCRTAFIFGGDWGRGMLASKKTLENSRCIFIIRNPYHALESLKKSRSDWNRKVLHPVNFAEVINYYYFFWNNRKRILDERTILIRFEDLVSEPEKVMKKVARHVGVEYSKNLVSPTLLGSPWRGGSSFGRVGAGVDRSVLERKIEVLNETEIGMIKEHLKPILDHFDYRAPLIPARRRRQGLCHEG